MPINASPEMEGGKTGGDTTPSLRRNVGFQLLWSGSALYSVGVEVAELVFPLLILALTGSPAWAGLFAATQLLAAFLCGLPAGQVADRVRPRSILLCTDGVRAVTALAVAYLAYTEELSPVMLLLVAAVLGATMPFGGAARMLLLRALVPTESLSTALIQDEVRSHGAGLAGPPLGGFLYGLSTAVPLLGIGVLSTLSWISTLLIRPARPEREGGAGDTSNPRGRTARDGGALIGVKVLWSQPALRSAVLLVTILNMVGAPLVLISVIMLREQSVSPTVTGIAMTGLALGGLVGTVLVKPLHSRLNPGPILLIVAFMQVPLLIALALPLGPWWITGILFCAMLGVPGLRVLVDVLIFRQVPDDQRGRVIAATMTLFTLGAPLGTLLAALLLEFMSPAGAFLALATLCALGAVYASSRREVRHASWPSSTEP